MQSIAWQETRSGRGERGKYGIVGDRTTSKGKIRPLGEKSYGVCQVRLSSAKDVLRKFPDLGSFKTDEELLVALMTDDRFNIRIATYHFKLQLNMFSMYTDSWRRAVLAYNVGCGRVKKSGFKFDPNKYLDSICLYVVYFKNNPVIK